MDETTTLVAVAAFVVVVCAGRLLLAMLGGGRGTGVAAPRAGLRRIGRGAGAPAPGVQARRKAPASLSGVGRLADDEVRRVLDDLKAKVPPRR